MELVTTLLINIVGWILVFAVGGILLIIWSSSIIDGVVYIFGVGLGLIKTIFLAIERSEKPKPIDRNKHK